MKETLRLAVVQMDVRIDDIPHNQDAIARLYTTAAQSSPDLVLFPEAALSGYCYNSYAEVKPYLLSAAEVERFCRRLMDMVDHPAPAVALGFLEIAEDGVYNSAILCQADGSSDVYRKTHLPVLGVDRFIQRGSEIGVMDVAGVPTGVLICYDIRFPEAARIVALRGADLLLLPTNWPEGAESAPDYVLRARARENRIYIAAANRIGMERGRRFIGRSQIVDPSGTILSEATANREAVLIADIEPAAARAKRIVIEPGAWEQDTLGDRRPELYGELTT